MNLARLYSQVRRNQMKGVMSSIALAGNTLMPTAYAEGRIFDSSSQVYDSAKGILGVDLGASAAHCGRFFGGKIDLGSLSTIGSR